MYPKAHAVERPASDVCFYLQAATTVDELQAQGRWAVLDAEGQQATFEAAVPVPKFRPPDKAAAVAGALPIVTAAYKYDTTGSCLIQPDRCIQPRLHRWTG